MKSFIVSRNVSTRERSKTLVSAESAEEAVEFARENEASLEWQEFGSKTSESEFDVQPQETECDHLHDFVPDPYQPIEWTDEMIAELRKTASGRSRE